MLNNIFVDDMIIRMKTIKPLKEIIENTGIPQSTISTWKSKNTFPKADDLYKIAEYLNVSMNWLLTGSDKINNLSENETILLSNYRLLDDTSKHHIDLITEALTGK